MKSLHLLAILALILFSCSKTNVNEEEAFVPNPTIIAEYHTLNSNGEIISKHYFDETGRLDKYHKLSNDYLIEFEYDINQKLISISKTDVDGNVLDTPMAINYDANDKVTSIEERLFSFDDIENKYTEDSSYHERILHQEGDIRSNSFDYRYYEVNITANANIISSRYYDISGDNSINITTGEIVEEYEYISSGWAIGFLNNNIRGEGSFDSSGSGIFGYNTLNNPLNFENSNFKDIYILFYPNSLNMNLNADILNAMQPTLSVNNKILWEDSSPESIEYLFEFNNLDLPTQSTYQYYYAGQPEGNSLVNAKYYYQTDEIPE